MRKSLRHCKRQIFSRPALVGPQSWQKSCRDGLLEFSVPRVPGSLDVPAGWPTGLAGRSLTCGVLWLIGQVNGMCFLPIQLL